MSVLNKIARVSPVSSSPYIKGTEKPNYYLVVQDAPSAVVGFRPLSVAVPPVGSQPQFGVQTRIRVVPTGTENDHNLGKLLKIIGFESHLHDGETEVHFSLVTSDPEKVLGSVSDFLDVLGDD